MTDSQTLRELFEDNIKEIDDWGNLDDGDIQDTLLEIADRAWGDVGKRRTRRITGEPDFLSSFVEQNLKNNPRFVTHIINKKDFDFFDNLIQKSIQAPLAERIGIERAKTALRSNINDQNAINFLRAHTKGEFGREVRATLGGFGRQAQRRSEALRILFEGVN